MTLVRDLMSTNVVAIKETATIDAAIELMLSNGVSGIPVVNELGNHTGIITEFDAMQLYMANESKERSLQPCSEFMNRNLRTISADATVDAAVSILRASRIRRLIVVDGHKLVGVLSRRDIIRAVREQRADIDVPSLTDTPPAAVLPMQPEEDTAGPCEHKTLKASFRDLVIQE